jgi:hypothetical protein
MSPFSHANWSTRFGARMKSRGDRATFLADSAFVDQPGAGTRASAVRLVTS